MRTLILFIDALGFSSITKDRTPKLFELFSKGLFRPVKTLLGYSNTIIPSIFSGAYPFQHDIWGIYRLSPETSPFKVPPFLPPSIFDRNLLLRYFANTIIYWSSKKRGLVPNSLVAANIPLKLLKHFDVSAQKSIADPRSIGSFPTIFDLAQQAGISIDYVGYPHHKGTGVILELAEKRLKDSSAVVAYIDEIDHNQHKYGVNSPEFRKLLLEFDELCSSFLSRILSRKDVRIIAFSDHGMRDVSGFVDLRPTIKSMDLQIEKDFLFFLDSTIARFWAFNEGARIRVLENLKHVSFGHVLSNAEIDSFGINFKHNAYGNVFFLADPGKLILPNFYTILGGGVKAMHGWNPSDKDQDSFFFSSADSVMDDVSDVKDVTRYFAIMRKALGI